MKTYFPYYWKYIGAVLIAIALVISIIANVDEFRRGFYGMPEDGQIEQNSIQINSDFEFHAYFTKEEVKPWITLSLCLSIFGFILYMFSKEKVEDEFYQQLRAKCLQKSLLYTWLFTAFVHLFFSDYELDGFYILQLHLFIYAITYDYNKANVYNED